MAISIVKKSMNLEAENHVTFMEIPCDMVPVHADMEGNDIVVFFSGSKDAEKVVRYFSYINTDEDEPKGGKYIGTAKKISFLGITKRLQLPLTSESFFHVFQVHFDYVNSLTWKKES